MARGSKSKDPTLAQTLGTFLDKRLIPDLRARVEESPAVKRALDEALAREKAAGRTADDPIAYRERTLEQIGAAWLLDSVFVRFLEDRGFLPHRRLAGDGATDAQERFGAALPGLAGNAREYLLAVFREVGRLPGARELLAPNKDLARRLGPSAAVAGEILHLLRETLPDGRLRWRFDSDDTRVLGDLYQDLSAAVRERYALLQTPDFVESFILDHTLVPAVTEFGLDGLRVIDPTCGSGHFVLGAFAHLREQHEKAAPGDDPKQHALAALQHVYGVDLNPFAVAITRFRLLVAYLLAAKIRHLRDAPADLPLASHVVVADSLLYGGKTPSLADHASDNAQRRLLGGEHFLLDDPAAASSLFARSYHAVVGNPPYIVCRDSALRELYRARYPNSAKGKFALAAPFTERFFELGVDGGFVGLINANSFMKRTFGRGLVEKVLAPLDLTGVIDTSGAFIPGHGTPTVILFGRNQKAKTEDLRAALGRRGEPKAPEDPKQGLVWSSIAAHFADVMPERVPRADTNTEPETSPSIFENEFVTVADLPRKAFASHPWSLGGGAAGELKQHIEGRCSHLLESRAEAVGVMCVAGEDDAFIDSNDEIWRRRGVDSEAIRQFCVGETIRDWACGGLSILYLHDSAGKSVWHPSAMRHLWPLRTTLGSGIFFGKTRVQRGLSWYSLAAVLKDKLRTPLSIAFAFVATHNHFVLDRGGRVFKQTAPIIKLPASSSETDHLALLAWLNSSTACLWMKNTFFNRGNGGIGGGIASEEWEKFFEFDSTKLLKLPVPKTSQELATDASELSTQAHVVHELFDMKLLRERGVAELTTAQRTAEATLNAMVGLQEELDWQWYEALGILDADDLEEHRVARQILRDAVGATLPVAPGHRAFECVLHRSAEETAWFTRNGYALPTDESLAVYPATYRALIELRVELIERNRFLGLLERPEYKRRWTRRDWDAEVQSACTDLLLDAIEAVAKREVVITSLRSLAATALREARVREVAALRFPGEDDPARALAALVEETSVPFLCAWRFTDTGLEKRAAWERTWDLQRREDAGETIADIPVPPKYDRVDYREPRFWSLRGTLDVPRERFIAYPGGSGDEDPSPLYGWAGWDHRQRAEALTALYLRRKDDDGWTAERLLPLLAGLDELVPWLKQWHNTPDAGEDLGAGDAYDAFVDTELRAQGLTRAQLRAWRPPEKRAGRAAKAKPEGAAKPRGRPKKGATEEETG